MAWFPVADLCVHDPHVQRCGEQPHSQKWCTCGVSAVLLSPAVHRPLAPWQVLLSLAYVRVQHLGDAGGGLSCIAQLRQLVACDMGAHPAVALMALQVR
jgi:hypothetical protein